MINRAFIFSEGIVGGTFVDWTLFYFSNTEEFYNPLDNTLNNVVSNPLTTHNAHTHNKIHPTSLRELKFCVNQLKDVDKFYTMYPFQEVSLEPFDTTQKWEENQNKIKKLHMSFQKYLIGNKCKTLIIRENKEDQLYLFFNRTRVNCSDSFLEIEIFYNRYFVVNKEKWNEFNQWDFREELALSLRPFETDGKLNINLPEGLLYEITYSDMLDNLDILIDPILKFFNIKKNSDKFEHWKNIYQTWRMIHDTKFYRNWRTIIDKIVSGKEFDLSDYKMDFVKDTFIQHVLIYKYNLNIRGFGVVSFPLNTALIYKLLEENIHPLDKNYQEFIKHV